MDVQLFKLGLLFQVGRIAEACGLSALVHPADSGAVGLLFAALGLVGLVGACGLAPLLVLVKRIRPQSLWVNRTGIENGAAVVMDLGEDADFGVHDLQQQQQQQHRRLLLLLQRREGAQRAAPRRFTRLLDLSNVLRFRLLYIIGVTLAASKLALCGSAVEGTQLVLLCDQTGLALLRALTLCWRHRQRSILLHDAIAALVSAVVLMALMLWECFREPCDYIASKATGNSTLWGDVTDKALLGIGLLYIALAHFLEQRHEQDMAGEPGEYALLLRRRERAHRRLIATTAALVLYGLFHFLFAMLPTRRVPKDYLVDHLQSRSIAHFSVFFFRLGVLITADWCLAWFTRSAPGEPLEQLQTMTPVLFAALVFMLLFLFNLGLPETEASACCYELHLYWLTVPSASILSWLVQRLRQKSDAALQRLTSIAGEERNHQLPEPGENASQLSGMRTIAAHRCALDPWMPNQCLDKGRDVFDSEFFRECDVETSFDAPGSRWRHHWYRFLAHVRHHREARKMLFALLLNLSYASIEFVCGSWSHSLSLVSDAAHMLLDASALLLALLASYGAALPPSRRFPFGLQRMQVLAGYTNALVLSLVALNIGLEALWRLVEPLPLQVEPLLPVACIGLAVNILGLWLLHDHHHHDHHHHHHHHHDHHHHLRESCSAGAQNMGAAYLHLLADTLGSIGVIITSILVRYQGLAWSDPVCSMLIASLILVTTMPCVRQCYELLAGVYAERQQRKLTAELFQHPLLSDGHTVMRSLRICFVTWDRALVTLRLETDACCRPETIRSWCQHVVLERVGPRTEVFVEIQRPDCGRWMHRSQAGDRTSQVRGILAVAP